MISGIVNNIISFFRSDRGKKLSKWLHRLFVLGVSLWLVWQLTEIGWLKVWKSLPTHPLFYILFLVIYFSLPLVEIFIYKITWTYRFKDALPVFLLKKVYNKDVLGYSGEVYFYVWARNYLKLTDKDIIKTIKDNNVISSVASTLFALVLLSAFLYTDQIKILELLGPENKIYIWGGAFLMVLLIALIVRFRHYAISMPLKTAFSIFSIHTVRLTIGQSLQILQWFIVLPLVPIHVWFTFVSIQIIMTRIPLLPNRDLVFIGAGIGLSGALNIPTADIAALLLVNTVLGKTMNLLLFSMTHIFKRHTVTGEESEAEFEETADKLTGTA